MNRDLVIGIDSSTTATKAIAWDRAGPGRGRRPRADRRCPIREPGWFEQDPNDWWRSTAQALKDVTAKIDPARIAAVGISNQRETFGIFAEDGTALRPGTVWLDERARAAAEELRRALGAERMHRDFRQAARHHAVPLPLHLAARA